MREYPTIEEINEQMAKGFEIDEDWLNKKAQEKIDKENFKKIRLSKRFL